MDAPRLREVPWHALRTEVALPAIARCLQGGVAEREVDSALRAHRDLSRDERRAVVEAIFGVALWRRRLAWHAGIEPLSTEGAPVPHPTPILSRGSDIPRRLLTALLRDLALRDDACALTGLTELPPPKPAPQWLACRWSLPDWLASHLQSELGTQAAAFCAAIAVPGPICLRANGLLTTREALADRLAAEGLATRPAETPGALFVETRNPNLFGSAAFRDGWFEAQDEGSQRVGNLVAPERGDTVLDLCAGAGGKSLLLAAQGAKVFAYDIDKERLGRLKTRAARARATNLVVVDSPVKADHVLVDAPCSELGTLRRGPDARWRVRLDDGLPPLQRDLLASARTLARKSVTYVTCTVNRAENEDVAQGGSRLKLLPHLDGTDGFFAVRWEQP